MSDNATSHSHTVAQPPERIIQPRHGWLGVDVAELWRYRELFLFLTWRDILIRYKQAYIGVAWAVLQPLLMMVIFTAVGNLAKVPSAGHPSAVLYLAGVVPWFFVANAMRESSNSLIMNQNMITKIYFPRIIAPASAVLSGLVDLAIALVILLGMMLFFRVMPQWRILLLPGFILVGFASALSIGLWLSALNVKYRDVKYVVPFLVQMGMFLCGVVLPAHVIPESLRFWFFLNPIAGVVEGFRWCILGAPFGPDWTAFFLSLILLSLALTSGVLFFRKAEKTFADVI